MQAENYRIGCVGRTGQCRGAACRSRLCTCSSYKLALKRYKPIASVAALSERLVQGNSIAWGYWCTTALT